MKLKEALLLAYMYDLQVIADARAFVGKFRRPEDEIAYD